MEKYISLFIIEAEPMDEKAFTDIYSKSEWTGNGEIREGYHIHYGANIDSWTTKEDFEATHGKLYERDIGSIVARRKT